MDIEYSKRNLELKCKLVDSLDWYDNETEICDLGATTAEHVRGAVSPSAPGDSPRLNFSPYTVTKNNTPFLPDSSQYFQHDGTLPINHAYVLTFRERVEALIRNLQEWVRCSGMPLSAPSHWEAIAWTFILFLRCNSLETILERLLLAVPEQTQRVFGKPDLEPSDLLIRSPVFPDTTPMWGGIHRYPDIRA